MLRKDIWRVLYVKCFSRIFYILLILSTSAYANSLRPYGHDGSITNGDIINVLIESDKADEELAKLQGKRVTSLFYVLKFKKINEDRVFEIIVTNPPKEEKPEDNKFLATGFKYNFDESNVVGDFILFDEAYKLKKNPYYEIIKILMIIFVLFLFVVLFKFIRRKIELNTKKKNKRIEILNTLQGAHSRSGFEEVLKNSDLIKSHFETTIDLLEEYKEELNKIQYKKQWTESEIATVLSLVKKLIQRVESHGI